MKAVHFGAGSIGRGFIGDLLHDSEYEIVFVDVNMELINQINRTNSYNLYLINDNYKKKIIDNARAVSSIENEKEVIEEIKTADIITTSVWADNLSKIAPILSKGLMMREKEGREKINVLACENAMFNSKMLKTEILKSDNGFTEKGLDKVACFPNTSVDRMVLQSIRDGEQTIDIGKDFELVIEKNKLANPQSKPIKGAIYTDNLQKFLERKLYVINGGHAWAGYMGNIYGYKIIQDVFNNKPFVEEIRKTMLESSSLLSKKYGFSMEELRGYIDFAISRFQTPGIKDTIERVCRSPIRKLGSKERLVGPCVQCEDYGIDNSHLLKGIASVFLFDNPKDIQCVQLQNHIKDYGIENTISYYTGIGQGNRMYEVILEQYMKLNEIQKESSFNKVPVEEKRGGIE